ncbi:hypothetical protein J4732_19755 [Serratia marcescens]|uniref:Thioesterase domain-containing protein n=1 Tax=Serratia marcescens TaxID=615 RepID=A0A939NKN8_SERMA|nr:hypothetical protein [Serratia marcescens]
MPWPAVEKAGHHVRYGRQRRGVDSRVQPRGPYHLAGYSSGGVLAYAIAEQLQSAGEAVAFWG